MNKKNITNSLNEHNSILEYNNIIMFILILLLFLIIFYNDTPIISNQKYIGNIYNKQLYLKKKFDNFINPNYKINVINDKMWLVEDILNDDYLNYLQKQFLTKKFITKDFYFRKATGIDFNDLHKSDEYNGFLELYYSDMILNILTNILKKPINRPPLSDNNSCSLLIYSNPGDFIDWHKDYSNYYGDRYVVLLSLINSNNSENNVCCSSNEFLYVDNENNEKKLILKPNNLLIFKGSEILHKSTKINEGEKRILLSMTFCDICQEKKNISYNIYEKIKNYIFYK